MKSILIDVTEDFLSKSTPGIGRIIIEQGVDINTHTNEIETAKWLLKTFGGEITIISEKYRYKVKYPDYEWNYKYWELKNVKGLKSLDSDIRKALKQIAIKPGGIILDISKLKDNRNRIIGIISNRLARINIVHFYIIIKHNNTLVSILLNKKRS